jgi:Tfp pilus assembly protein PilE
MKNRAFSLIELMCYLLISSVILAIVSQAYHSIAKSSVVYFRKNQIERKFNAVEHILYQAINKNSFHQYIPTHYWHTSLPRPSYIQNALNRLSTSSQPTEHSAVLEIVELLPLLFTRSKGNQLTFSGNIEIDKVSMNNIKGIFSPEPLANFRISGKLTLKHLAANDWKLTLSAISLSQAEILLTNENLKYTSRPNLILPLTDHYILFTSNENVLRRVSLITSENQPLLENISLNRASENSCLISYIDDNISSTRSTSCKNLKFSSLARTYAIDY